MRIYRVATTAHHDTTPREGRSMIKRFTATALAAAFALAPMAATADGHACSNDVRNKLCIIADGINSITNKQTSETLDC